MLAANQFLEDVKKMVWKSASDRSKDQNAISDRINKA
jgi:hypothetical protein